MGPLDLLLNHSPAAWSAFFAALALLVGLINLYRTRRAPEWSFVRTNNEREGVYLFALINDGDGAAYDVVVSFGTRDPDAKGPAPRDLGRIGRRQQVALVPPGVGTLGPAGVELVVEYRAHRRGRRRTFRTTVL